MSDYGDWREIQDNSAGSRSSSGRSVDDLTAEPKSKRTTWLLYFVPFYSVYCFYRLAKADMTFVKEDLKKETAEDAKNERYQAFKERQQQIISEYNQAKDMAAFISLGQIAGIAGVLTLSTLYYADISSTLTNGLNAHHTGFSSASQLGVGYSEVASVGLGLAYMITAAIAVGMVGAIILKAASCAKSALSCVKDALWSSHTSVVEPTNNEDREKLLQQAMGLPQSSSSISRKT
ncbi:MAG: hypothetical protein QM752_04855 [Gammaproteobacteria bacterium]